MHEFDENSVYLRNFHDPYQADLSGSFDFVLLEVGHSAIERMADCADLSGVRELCAVGERADPVLGGLMAALFADMNGQLERSPLFVDQLSVAIGIHVAQHYGSASHRTTSGAAIKGRRLSARSLSMVQELMRSRLGGDLSIEELAEACHLSQGTFLRAFRQTLGITPFQWFLQQRLDRARDMLEFSSLTIGEIAVASGFADQSHFTRVFARATGASPAPGGAVAGPSGLAARGLCLRRHALHPYAVASNMTFALCLRCISGRMFKTSAYPTRTGSPARA